MKFTLDDFLRVFLAIGMAGLMVAAGWLIWRELQFGEAHEFQPVGHVLSDEVGALRDRLQTLRSRSKRHLDRKIGARFGTASSQLEALRARLENAEEALGENLRPTPDRPFEPEALFVAYSSGRCIVKLLGWELRGGRAVYNFKISYPHEDLGPEEFVDVREGENVGDLVLVSAVSPTRSGGSREEVVRITRRGQEVRRKKWMPDYRVVRLLLERRSNRSEKFSLEAPYNDVERRKAGFSQSSFVDTVAYDIPLATIAFRDEPDGGTRSLLAKEGGIFAFDGQDYLLRSIRPDQIEVQSLDQREVVHRWARVDGQTY